MSSSRVFTEKKMEPTPVEGVKRIVNSHVIVEIQRGRVRISPSAQLPASPAMLPHEIKQPRATAH